MKVLCISNGNQLNDRKVHKGETYTVFRIVKGWEVLNPDSEADFYMLEEMGSKCVYHSKLFIPAPDPMELELVEVERGKGYN